MKLGRGCHKRTPRWCWAILLVAAAVASPRAAFGAAGGESDAMKRNRVGSVGGEICSDSPSDEKILTALANSKRRVCWPYLHEESRSNVRIVKEKIAERYDPPCAVPLLGRARLHHKLYKCTVYFTERIQSGWPVPQQTMVEAAEVVYLEHRRFCTVAESGDDVDAPEAAP